ncbi:GerAB/ArcD/ProY family transporter [Gracilibacillus xinjiangensis]|uniref:Endospore germination permease n=1 Tax=Gracilibacillus xinjiangensis TaxID=1193282 RepID=A0ABV8WQS5_9BACI
MEKIDGKQFTILVIMNTLGASIIFIPTIATGFGKENGWLTVFFSIVFGMLIVFMYSLIIKHQAERDIFCLIEDTFGKWFGVIIIVLFNGYLFTNASANLWAIGDFMSLQILMGTPEQAIELIIIGTTLIAIRHGIEVIGRTAEVFFPFTMLSTLLLTLLVMKEANWQNIQPVFQLYRLDTFVGTIPIIVITFMELFILLGITHKVTHPKNAQKGLLLGAFISGLLLLVITTACIVVLGVKATTHYTYPIYALGQRISLFNFLERVEILVAFIWFFTIFFKISITFYILSNGMSYLLKLKNHKTLSIPLALLLFLGSVILIPTTFNVFTFIYGPYLVFSVLFTIILPICILLISVMKSKREKGP